MRRTGAWLILLAAMTSVVATCTTAGAGELKADSAGLITFWNDDPSPSIWTVRPDGSGRGRVLRNRQNAKRARLSPDRGWIAFDGNPPGEPTLSDFDIQLVRRNGSGLRTLTRSNLWDTDPQWSPDGKLISFTRAPEADWTKAWIWTIRRNGSRPQPLVRGQRGRWSPDGVHLVYDAPTTGSPGDLFVVDADGRNRRLLLGSRQLDQPADWSPDGKRILFTRFDDTSPATSVWVVNVDGTGARRLSAGLAGSWSPDSSEIVYARSFPGRLFVMSRNGTRNRAIPGAVGADPDWG